jgi:RNA polymerase sigma-70 factor (ECF subfamily)
MFKSLLKRVLPPAAAEVERPLTSANPHPDYTGLVSRIIDGDAAAEDELVAQFKDAVFHIICRIANDTSMVEDFSQDTFLTLIKKIRKGDLRRAESLGSFVAAVARNHAIEQMRVIRRRAGDDLEHAEQVPDTSPSPLENLLRSAQIAEIREMIEELRPRYRVLLRRFYINEEPKEVICADLGLTSGQFDGVLHRARKRCGAIYLKRKGLAEKSGGR